MDSFPESENIREGRENFKVNTSMSESSMAILESEEFNPPVNASSEESTFYPPKLPAIEELSIYEAEPSNLPLTLSIVEVLIKENKSL